MFYIYLMILLNVPLYAQDNLSNQSLSLPAPTNNNIIFKADFENLQIGKPFSVKYTMPNEIAQIIEIDSNITVQADTDISVTSINQKELEISVTSYGLQSYPMPSLLITALDQQNNTNQFYTPSFSIPITNKFLTNTNISLADIEPIYFVWDHWWTIMLVLFVLIICGLIFIPRLLKPTEKKVIEPVIDPYELVQRKLQKLKVQSFELNDDNYKVFFVDLSETLREFLSYTLIPLALEMPTREIMLAMKEIKLEDELQEIIIALLRNTDRAKYAKQIFVQERINEAVQDSFTMVQLVQKKQERENNNEL